MFDLSAQQFLNFKRAFDLFDKDGNGSINKQEIATVFKELNIKLANREIDNIMNQFDENGDQCIQFQQFLTVLTTNIDKGETQSWLLQVFQIMDQDCDGLLSKKQLMNVVKVYNLQIQEKEINQIFQTIDCDEGGINYQQFSNFLKGM